MNAARRESGGLWVIHAESIGHRGEGWPQDLGFDAFCHWFDFQHHAELD
jgi:hypothetical protein